MGVLKYLRNRLKFGGKTDAQTFSTPPSSPAPSTTSMQSYRPIHERTRELFPSVFSRNIQEFRRPIVLITGDGLEISACLDTLKGASGFFASLADLPGADSSDNPYSTRPTEIELPSATGEGLAMVLACLEVVIDYRRLDDLAHCSREYGQSKFNRMVQLLQQMETAIDAYDFDRTKLRIRPFPSLVNRPFTGYALACLLGDEKRRGKASLHTLRTCELGDSLDRANVFPQDVQEYLQRHHRADYEALAELHERWQTMLKQVVTTFASTSLGQVDTTLWHLYTTGKRLNLLGVSKSYDHFRAQIAENVVRELCGRGPEDSMKWVDDHIRCYIFWSPLEAAVLSKGGREVIRDKMRGTRWQVEPLVKQA